MYSLSRTIAGDYLSLAMLRTQLTSHKIRGYGKNT